MGIPSRAFNQADNLCTCTGPYSGTVMLSNDDVELNLFYTF